MTKILHFFYNLAIYCVFYILKHLAHLIRVSHTKFQRFVMGQVQTFSTIEEDIKKRMDPRPVFWIHAASYGEYNAARPIISKLHASGKYQIIMTFFSATGVDMVSHRREIVDAVYFLPLDTPRNVRKFINLINPQRIAFVISEYWINYLFEIHKRQIPCYLISAHITTKAPFMRWDGILFRQALKAFTKILVMDKDSYNRLESIGFSNTVLTGDPLFDNVATRAAAPYKNTIVENFVKGHRVLIAGSITEMRDLYMTAGLAYLNPDTKIIVVPHEISGSYLRRIQVIMRGKACLYSECTEDTDFSDTQALIIDFMGALAYLYRYGHMAYVGGGFTRTLHSVVEAAVYGIPVAFGPRAERQQTAFKLIEYGIGTMVTRVREFNKWYRYYESHPNDLEAVKQHASAMMLHHKGASQAIADIITEEL